MEITVLCKVVDNFGDIGVVYRLCRRLLNIQNDLSLNLVVDDLTSFSKICKSVDCGLEFQLVQGINVWKWDASALCHQKFMENDGQKLSVILECFQCGRPDWMEKILFEEKLNRTVHIVMIDYLTAEDYAEQFHCLASLTRSAKVQKVNFMPGFTEKTGGLIIDDEWAELSERNADGNVLVFTYEQNCAPLAESLSLYCKNKNKRISLAEGHGKNAFLEAWKEIDKGIDLLSFMNQDEWDKMMKNCSLLVIRGEESMSRACLSGIPFIWHAYPQSEEYQLVKVRALLERMKVHFKAEDFEIINQAFLLYNTVQSDCDRTRKALYDFFEASEWLLYGFKDFALSLRKNGDLGMNLMTFIQKNCIIE